MALNKGNLKKEIAGKIKNTDPFKEELTNGLDVLVGSIADAVVDHIKNNLDITIPGSALDNLKFTPTGLVVGMVPVSGKATITMGSGSSSSLTVK